VDFFTRTVTLFQGLPSYQWLTAAGITPSSTATYTAAQIQSALQSKFGQQVTINCVSGALNEIWYHYNVQGSVQTGSFVPTTPDSGTGTCPSTGSKLKSFHINKVSFTNASSSQVVTKTKWHHRPNKWHRPTSNRYYYNSTSNWYRYGAFWQRND
jgi:ribonuclease T2